MDGIISSFTKTQASLTPIPDLPESIKPNAEKIKTVMTGVTNPIIIHEYFGLILKFFFLIKREFTNIPEMKKQQNTVIKKDLNFPAGVAYIDNNPEAKNQTEQLIKYLNKICIVILSTKIKFFIDCLSKNFKIDIQV